jgi:hypothetical protein
MIWGFFPFQEKAICLLPLESSLTWDFLQGLLESKREEDLFLTDELHTVLQVCPGRILNVLR